ncbi:GNAT family N-acetyltransferase [Polluticoccus soli]|uniref:GNAT family N-acetyltransferase n=1 Tax=Polluticoccus soli TaxID=3034150 RepID=UPI0023E25E42|nr:GNAT family N-acetyltransferase [Flavipsychrobacter sp. JY13-12]
MNDIELELDPTTGNGAFKIEENGERLAEMVFRITANKMVIFHTEVSQKLSGQGVGKRLVTEMLAYVRSHDLKVVPLCPFVHGLFQRHPEEYADVWDRGWHSS